MITIVGLNKTLGSSKVINGFDLTIKAGEVMCLLGTNGSGKTTLVNLITGLIPLDTDDGGDVSIFLAEENRHVSLRASITEFRSYVRLCQQDDFLFDELTANEHLELVCRLRGIKDSDISQVVLEKAREVDVETEIHKKVKFISPGAKRKLSIAMALIGDAKFIILDEPTSNLDLKSREKIWLLIRKIAQDKERCILISTQHIEEADYIGTKICIIKDGVRSHCDTPDKIKRKFGNGFKVKMVSDETRH